MYAFMNAAVNCSTPPAVDGLVIEPYNDTTEGAVIYYNSGCAASLHQDNDLEQRMVMCTSNGSWSPQLQGKKFTKMQAVIQLIFVSLVNSDNIISLQMT